MAAAAVDLLLKQIKARCPAVRAAGAHGRLSLIRRQSDAARACARRWGRETGVTDMPRR
jgi:hypothetical protein